jgi:hypothetical protein
MRPSQSMIDSKSAVVIIDHVTHAASLADHTRMSVPQFSQETDASFTRSSSITSKKNLIRESPRVRFAEACADMDKRRQSVLVKKRYIGKILDIRRPDHILNTTEVSFRWQLGLLIGWIFASI